MATNGLFGANDQLQQLLEKRRLEQANQRQQLGNLFASGAKNRAQAATNNAGAQVGASFGQGFAKGILGESEQIKGARARAEAASGVEETPQSYLDLAGRLDKVGDSERAILARRRAAELAKEQLEVQAAAKQASSRVEYISTIAEKYPDVASYIESGGTIEKAQSIIESRNKAPASAITELQSSNGVNRKYLINKETGDIIEDLGVAPKKKSDTSIVNNIGGEPDPFLKKLGEKEAERFVKTREAAELARTAMQGIDESITLLNSNEGIISGTAGEFRLNASKALAQAGIIESDSIANTEAFFANQGNQVAQVITAFGAGTGLSDADREFAKQIAGGEISLSENSLRKILDIRKRALTNLIGTYNTRAQQISEKNPQYSGVVSQIELPKVKNVIAIEDLPTEPSSIAVNPQTKQKIFLINGTWVDRFGNAPK